MAGKRRTTDEVEEVVYERCCGMDIHKDDIKACLNIGGRKEVKVYSTMTDGLLEMAKWLKENEVQMVAMESTASYWKPVFNILESEDIPVILANSKHIKNFSDPKTDRRDAKWISNLLRHGLIRASFVPARDMRELRELIKYRSSLTEESTRMLNRIDKILQGANIKLSSVICKTDTKTEQAILEALANGETDIDKMAKLAQGTLKNKEAEIKRALNGLMGDHQRLMLKSMCTHLKHIKDEIAVIEAEIDKRMEKDDELIERIEEIPGVGKISAQSILAEIGTDMDQFPDEHHLSSWAGVAPNSNESAGKRKNAKSKKGNSNLKKTLVQCANSAANSKDNYLSAQHKRIAARRGYKKANVAVAHTILIIIYHMIKNNTAYCDLGANFFDVRNKEAIVKRSTRRIEELGYYVTLKPKPDIIEGTDELTLAKDDLIVA